MKSFVGNKSQMNSKEFLKMKLWYIRETVEFLFKTTYCLTESSFSERRLVASGNVAKMQKKKFHTRVFVEILLQNVNLIM